MPFMSRISECPCFIPISAFGINLTCPKDKEISACPSCPSGTAFVPQNFTLNWDYTIDTTTSFVPLSCAMSGRGIPVPIVPERDYCAKLGKLIELQANARYKSLFHSHGHDNSSSC